MLVKFIAVRPVLCLYNKSFVYGFSDLLYFIIFSRRWKGGVRYSGQTGTANRPVLSHSFLPLFMIDSKLCGV